MKNWRKKDSYLIQSLSKKRNRKGKLKTKKNCYLENVKKQLNKQNRMR